MNEDSKEQLIYYVENPEQKFLFHCGEQFIYESLPVGTRILYPPLPLPSIENISQAIDDAIENPINADPLSTQLKSGMKLTIAFDDISIVLPQVSTNRDPRKLIIERILKKCSEKGVSDIHIISALGLHRKMTPQEIRYKLGDAIFKQFFPKYLYNHDAEDPDGNVMLDKTEQNEEIWINRRVAESDLLIYVNITPTSMDGGFKSINVGLTTYRSLKYHHNVNTLMNCKSYMDPQHSALHSSLDRMGRITAKHIKSFHIETTLNTATFPSLYNFLEKMERDWTFSDSAKFNAVRQSMRIIPFNLRWSIWQSQRAPYGITSIQAGEVESVHSKTLENLFKQQEVNVKGQSDIVIAGTPYICPYNVNSIMNPLLVWSITLGYCFNMYRGQPLLKKGGVLIFTHPLYKRFNAKHHPSYIDFYEQVLSDTKDPVQIEKKYEEKFVNDERYRKMFREGYAYHGVHPFYMWYWGIYAKEWAGKIIFVPGNKDVAERLGVETATTIANAIEQAKDIVGDSPSITYYHWPPLFLCNVYTD